MLAEESSDTSSEMKDQEHGLSNAVNSMAASMDPSEEFEYHKEKHREYEQECRDKFSNAVQPQPEVKDDDRETDQQDAIGKPTIMAEESIGSGRRSDAEPFEELTMLDHKRKVAVLFELLTACLAVTPEPDRKAKRRKYDYDARHRVALRLLSTWFDIEWIKMVSSS